MRPSKKRNLAIVNLEIVPNTLTEDQSIQASIEVIATKGIVTGIVTETIVAQDHLVPFTKGQVSVIWSSITNIPRFLDLLIPV